MIAPELQNAINLCVEGNYLEALPILQGAADKGDVEASLACAKVFCYQNQWQEAGMYASKMVLSFKHQTDFDLLLDSWRIVTLSGICTGDWQLADKVVAKCENYYDKKYEKKPAKKSEAISARAKAKSHPRVTYYRAFKKMIKRRAAGFIAYPVFPEPREARKDRLLNFRRAKKRILTSEMRRWSGKNFAGYWGQKIIDDVYKEAVDCALSEKSLQFYHETGRYPNNHFALLDLALAFLDSNDRRRASYAQRRSIQTYEPASSYDLLPVTLFWIPEIREFLNPSRTEKLLQLKRDDGPTRSYKFLARENMADVKNSRFIGSQHHQRAAQATDSEIQRWESCLSACPDDLLLRFKLLEVYPLSQFHSEISRKALVRHVFWFIENKPHYRSLEYLPTIFKYPEDQKKRKQSFVYREYDQGKKLWLQKVGKYKGHKQVSLNAARYLQLEDADIAESILWTALDKMPLDSEILWRLWSVIAMQYSDSSRYGSKTEICERMLRVLRQFVPMDCDLYNAHLRVSAAAWCAVEVERFDEAKVFAIQGINDLNKSGGEPLSLCYSALGMVAMTEGKHKEALADLDKAFGAIEDSNFRDAAAAMILASELAGSHKTGVLKILCKYRDRADNKVKRELKHFVELIENGGEMKYLNGNSLMPSLS